MIRRGVRRALWLALRRRDRWELEVEEEIKLHLALRAEQLMADGQSADDAYAEALRRFGSLSEARDRLVSAARHREQTMQRTEYFGDLRQDVSFALRGLARQKVWTVVTVLTLALGIGATTAVFSVVSTLLLHPLPYPDANRIVYVNQQPSGGNNTGIQVTITPSAPVVRAWMKYSHALEAVEGTTLGPKALKTKSGEPDRVMAEEVFPTYTRFTGSRVVRGRMFTANDIAAGNHVLLVSEAFWNERLGANPAALGQMLNVDSTAYTIIGVLHDPTPMGGWQPVDVWMPLDVRNDSLGMSVMARLRPGATPTATAKELDSIYARSTGFTSGSIPFRTIVSTPQDRVSFRDSLVMLTVAVGLVLLVACANVAHLLLARSMSRQRELAIRAALGAGRGRLLRQLLTESLLLSTIGAACGLALGLVGLRVLVALRPDRFRELSEAHLDATTLGVAIGVSVLCGVAFAIMSALQSSRHSTPDALKTGSQTAAGASRRHGRGRAALVVSEMALAASLLVGATLLVRSVTALQRTDLGFAPNGLYYLSLPLNGPAFGNDAARRDAVDAVLARLRAMPSVASAAAAQIGPGSRSFSIGRLEIQGEEPPPKTSSSFIDVNAVQPAYFATLGMRVVEGGRFTDTSATSQQVMVNEGFARKHWSRGAAVGQRIRIAQTDSEPWLTVIGVVNDVRLGGPLAESKAPILYAPFARVNSNPAILVRTHGDAASLLPALDPLKRLGVRRLAPPYSVEENVGKSIAVPRFIVLLLTIFTLLALILTSVGLYGVMTYTVAQQTREIGIRVALGASGQRIARGVIARATALAIAGAAAGLIAASWGTKLIESQLHGVTRLDPASYVIGGAVLVGAALLASVVPVRRAVSVDPMTAIRAD